MKNKEIAAIFYEMADLLDILGVEWKPLAFRKAARVIESEPEDVEKIFRKSGEKGLKELEGVGDAIAKKIGEFIETGKVKEHEELKKQIPDGVESMLKIPGLGPKKVARLFKELKIDSLEKLEKLAKAEKIRKLSGFGEKSEEDILMGLELVKKGTERKLLGIILPYAEEIVNEIRKLPHVERAEVAGSLRRMRETVKDMDMLVFTRTPGVVSKAVQKLSEVEKVERAGDTLVSVRLKNGISADVRMLAPDLYGSGLVHFTGSKEHGIALRNRAIKMGMKFSEYGLVKGKKIVASKSEKDVYAALGLQEVPPEMRENEGEIELAEKKKLPEIVGYDDIRGDLHTHTVWSDGAHTTEQMVSRAVELGYEYYAITDHSKSDVVANGLNEKRVKEHMMEIDKLQKKFPQITLLKGSEVAILTNGEMDYSNKVLKELDIVIASIHSGFKNDEKKMTARMVGALENEHVTFIAHPTGRLINQRNPYALNTEKIMDAAQRTGKAFEINAFPSRLDFDAKNVHSCVERKIPLVINTDAHSVQNLDFMKFGIGQARRGWATKKDILNAQPLQKWLKK
ncbi:MAG: DNA polymerase/3'-5' exonuclease PolX [Candidatus Diapherotrites archaeon]|uniref:DNA polymerase beta n=1 Tax=Candidatus Iainarchaeum sp. TaxID=3101447 RepID=A0A8T4C6N9_9ARCH|nr:DNA polymerase/3'-5' exonuclease PolX [Candidatus Diapherotrites archaeon]